MTEPSVLSLFSLSFCASSELANFYFDLFRLNRFFVWIASAETMNVAALLQDSPSDDRRRPPHPLPPHPQPTPTAAHDIDRDRIYHHHLPPPLTSQPQSQPPTPTATAATSPSSGRAYPPHPFPHREPLYTTFSHLAMLRTV